MKKRSDLQSIRGMAILSVLLYHFYPKIFKNGYVGVDQFFILSGFLMAEILSRESCLTISGIISFYYRRMKRILPLYALFIFSTLLFSLMVFPFYTFTFNIPHAIRSLAFISNTKQEDESQTYERMLSDAEVLYIHTWSLSCEVQFYAIAPFLIVLPTFILKNYVVAIVGTISYLLFTYLMENGLQQFAFNFMFTRIWQFSIGILCSFLLRKHKTSADNVPLICKTQEKEFKHVNEMERGFFSYFSNLVCFSLLFVSWFPIEITPHFVRLFVCFLTAALIYLGAVLQNRLLSNRIVVYLGDISYSLYLIHWPVYVYLKQNHLIETTFGSFVGILCSALLAAIIYETYEKFYLKLEKNGVISLTLSLYIICAGLIVSFSPLGTFDTGFSADTSSTEIFKVPENLTIEMVTSMNRQFSNMDMKLMNMPECNYTAVYPGEKAPWAMCDFKNTAFSGQKRMLLIGNSYAPNIARMFIHLKECQKKAKQIQMYTGIVCEVLEDSSGGAWTQRCLNKTEKFREVVEHMKPDVLFITTLHITSMLPSEGSTDSILEKESKLLKRLEKNVKDKVYILDAFPRPVKPDLINRINNRIIAGNRTSQDSLVDKSVDYLLARKRMAHIAKECTKCELIDIMPTFLKNGTFQTYNEENGISYFADLVHLSAYGLQKISNVYKNVCNNIK